jgi:hypothetical protein
LLQYAIIQDVEDQIVLMSLPPCVQATLTVIHSTSLSISVSSIHSEAEQPLVRGGGLGSRGASLDAAHGALAVPGLRAQLAACAAGSRLRFKLTGKIVANID